MKLRLISALEVCCKLVLLSSCSGLTHAADTNTESRLRVLQEQNDALQSQLRRQQEQIDSLSREVAGMHNAPAAAEPKTEAASSEVEHNRFSLGKVQISGEAAVGIFHTGPEGAFPNTEFHVDEAKLFVDAPVWGNTYAFVELNIASREASDVSLHVGELYLDVEDISELWGHAGQLNLRVGRVDIPFGEEYLRRDAIDNPFISHSLPDFWGVDEGIEFYGALAKFSYVVAVQNGGVSDTRDFNPDKSVAGRLAYDPTGWLHLSVSGMRTGDLSIQNDVLSAMWFGGGWFRSLASPATATDFHLNMVEGDISLRLHRVEVSAFGGYARYDDNDSAFDNSRDVYYFSGELVGNVTRKLYSGVRFSQIFVDGGFPIVGQSPIGPYLFGPLTTDIWRCSAVLGYRWNKNLVLKTEYSHERGREVSGAVRDDENMVSAHAAFAF